MIKLPSYVSDFMSAFSKNGFQIYLVGGAVRDVIMGKQTFNWDFATDASPEKILALYPDGFYNNAYGTVGVSQETPDGKLLFETTTFRKEGIYSDSRHPDNIEWAKTIEEDLARRDFTMNAIAYDGKAFVDPFFGQEDIQSQIIRAVGEPGKRFSEDALRMMRAVRFSSQLGFLIDEKTRESIQKNASLITKISWERIRDELLRLVGSEHPAEGILFMRNTGLLGFILPEVDICFMIPQKSPNRHHIFDVGTHLVMSLKHCPSEDPITRLASLLHDIGKSKTFRQDEKTGIITFYNHEVVGTQMTKTIADRLRLSAKQKEKLVRLVQYHQFTVTETQTDKAIRRFIREVGPEYLQDILDVRTADRIGSGAKPTSWRLDLFKKRLIEVQKIPFQVKDLKINGNDVMEILDVKPGPEVGTVLDNIFNDVEEGRLKNDKEILIARLKELKTKT